MLIPPSYFRIVAKFVRGEHGATMLEYGLLIGLIAIVTMVGVIAFGGSLNTMLTEFSTTSGEVSTGQ